MLPELQIVNNSCTVSRINLFTPEFPKVAQPSFNLDTSIVANRGLVKINDNRMANSIDLDETAVMSRLIRIYTVYIGICFGLHVWKD